MAKSYNPGGSRGVSTYCRNEIKAQSSKFRAQQCSRYGPQPRGHRVRGRPAPSPVVDLNALDATTEDLHEAACDQAHVPSAEETKRPGRTAEARAGSWRKLGRYGHGSDTAEALRLMLDNAVDDSAESIGSTYGSARGVTDGRARARGIEHLGKRFVTYATMEV